MTRHTGSAGRRSPFRKDEALSGTHRSLRRVNRHLSAAPRAFFGEPCRFRTPATPLVVEQCWFRNSPNVLRARQTRFATRQATFSPCQASLSSCQVSSPTRQSFFPACQASSQPVRPHSQPAKPHSQPAQRFSQRDNRFLGNAKEFVRRAFPFVRRAMRCERHNMRFSPATVLPVRCAMPLDPASMRVNRRIIAFSYAAPRIHRPHKPSARRAKDF